MNMELPEISQLSSESRTDDVFICALGFEDRCTSSLKKLSNSNYSTVNSIFLRYETNQEDNNKNEIELLELLGKVSQNKPIEVNYLYSTPRDTIKQLKDVFNKIGINKIKNISIDISSFSSSAILQILDTVISDNLVTLRIIYTEAAEYYPKKDDTPSEEYLSHGLKDVITLTNFSGIHSAGYPHLLITFLGFSSIRARAIYNWYQPSKKIGIIGIPPRQHLEWRIKKQKEIHEKYYSSIDKFVELSTFNYNVVLNTLENLYDEYSSNYNIGIASFGSKLQTLALLIFLRKHPDVQAIFSVPKGFNASKYSESETEIWEIIFNVDALQGYLIKPNSQNEIILKQ